MKKAALLVIFILLLVVTIVLAADKQAAPGNFYGWAVYYLRQANETRPAALEVQEQVVVSSIDVILSAFCMYVALWMCTGTKIVIFKKYLWFIFGFNLAWCILLLVFRTGWEALDFLVIKLQPDLKDTVWNHFALAVVITPVFLYIWLIARTFSLKFYAALGTFLISHALYLLIIYLFISFIPSEGNGGVTLIKETMGLTPVVQSYLSDINHITTKQPLMSLLRVRPFHL